MVNEPKKNFDTSVTLSGLRLDNPVVPASGTFGYGNEYKDCLLYTSPSPRDCS